MKNKYLALRDKITEFNCLLKKPYLHFSSSSLFSSNKIYVDENLDISNSFITTMKTFFESEPEKIPFSNRESAVEKINDW